MAPSKSSPLLMIRSSTSPSECYCGQDCCHYRCQDYLQLWQRSTFCPPLLGQGGVGVQLRVLHRERLVLRVILDAAGQDAKMLGGHGRDGQDAIMPRCQDCQDAKMVDHDHHGQDWLVTIAISRKSTTDKTLFTWSTPNNNKKSPNNNKKSTREKTPFTWSTLISLSAKLIPSCKSRFIFLPKNIQTSPKFSRISNNAEHKTIS